MNVELKNIDTIIPYARNPRNNENAVDGVVASIKEFGFKQPIVVDKENVIIVGHTRFLAAKKLNMSEVPVLTAKDLSDAKVKAYRIADNRVNQNAMWDNDLLKIEFEEIPDELLYATGFDKSEINFIAEGWDADNERIENIEPIDGVDKDRIIIKCSHEQKQQVWEAVTNCIDQLGLDDVEVQ